MRNFLCVAAFLAACSSDDGGSVITLDWSIQSDTMGEVTCDKVAAAHVDWTIIKDDQTTITKSYECDNSGRTVSLTPGSYIKIEGLLRSTSTSVIATCDPTHDNPITADAHNVDPCVFSVP